MAGETEEPFRINFQADLLHSGSISFGRFESESLSWERRSSFSHNRYLEEVEKYSKPGSVTEKKAYFEAHFKRKALLKQSSSESQDGSEFPNTENNDLQDFQESETGNDSKHFTCFDESPYNPGHIKYENETEIPIRVNQNVETLCAENNNASSVDQTVTDTNHLNLEETHQSETANVDLIKKEEITKVTLGDSVVKVSMTSEMKQPKPKPKTQSNFAQVSRIRSIEVSNISTKTKIREIKSLTTKEKVNKSRPASSLGHSMRKTSKSEELSTSFRMVKIPPPIKSIVKENRSEKPLPGARQTANRTKQTILTPSKPPHVNPISTGFTFKSDQRAERMKEEKRAAAELNYQYRKSLNFKATPMPSFYKEASRSLDQNKAISAIKTPSRPRTASTGPITKKAPSNPATSSNPRPGSSTSSTNRNRLPEPSRRVQEKKKDLNLQTQKAREAITRPRVRDTKGVQTDTGLKPGYLRVGVAN